MKVRYSKRAVDDLIAVADYVRPTDLSIYNPSAAEAVEKRIRGSIARLSIFPFIGRATDDSVIRVLPITRYPYLVFYEVLGEEIVIHHIRDGRRAPIGRVAGPRPVGPSAIGRGHQPRWVPPIWGAPMSPHRFPLRRVLDWSVCIR
jgi:toxin ParE1/3/4